MVKGDDTDASVDRLEMLALSNRNALIDNRARSEERSKGKKRGSLRSRSVDPYLGRRPPTVTFMTQSYPPAGHPPIAEVMSKTSEYRSQFAWPPLHRIVTSAHHRDKLSATILPRKSVSMGAIQTVQETVPVKAVKHASGDFGEDEGIKSPTNEDFLRTLEEQMTDLKEEPVEDANLLPDDHTSRPKKFKTEYKSRFKAPSKYVYLEGSWVKNKDHQHLEAVSKPVEDIPVNWYGEVLELRKKAGEYKLRSWGTTIPDNPAHVYSHQKEVWEQVSQRSSLSALALATTPSPRGTRAEVDSARGRLPTRHHLERTTPSEGTLLTSPTRDHKLEPQIQKDKEPKTSPAKSKPSPKSSPGIVTGRSASVGPDVRSPKHTSRVVSSGPPSARSQVNVPHVEELPKRVDVKRPRPTSLSTTARSKSAVARGKDSVDGDSLPRMHTAGRSKSAAPVKTTPVSGGGSIKEPKAKKVDKAKDAALVNGDTTASSKDDLISPPEPPPKEELEYIPVIKSPPEPTRVKSPEQIIVKSPEPVKWTVPLDTGITWTDALQVDSDTTARSIKEEDVDKATKEFDNSGRAILPSETQSSQPGLAIFSNGESLYDDD